MPFLPQTDKTAGNRRSPQTHHFADDGRTPNNPRLPLLVYSDVVRAEPGRDRAATFEQLFADHGWSRSWRNGIHGFLHFHTVAHEVLGIARGEARVQFGGDDGQILSVTAGDVVVLPAGTGHQRLSGSSDLLVVGAYPDASPLDQRRPGELDHRDAVARIAKVGVPPQDPVYGRDGPLIELWSK